VPDKHEPDIAGLYHLHSSNVRCRTTDLAVDQDRHPMRFRSYPGAPRLPLPGRDFTLLDSPLGELLAQRVSHRDFSTAPLPLEMLGRLLYASYGVRGVRSFEGQMVYSRPTPSAGGLYPVELYVALQRVDGAADGVYHYDARAHELELLQPRNVQAELAEMTLGQSMLADAHVVVLLSAVFRRTLWKYGQRGYRYVWLDAGHIGQNLYLVAQALGLGAVAVGGFFDSELHRLIGLPDEEEEVIYIVCAGNRRE
jgi:SagB-type dehydrogenase family enzyme